MSRSTVLIDNMSKADRYLNNIAELGMAIRVQDNNVSVVIPTELRDQILGLLKSHYEAKIKGMLAELNGLFEQEKEPVREMEL